MATLERTMASHRPRRMAGAVLLAMALLPSTALANLLEQVTYSTTTAMESFPAIMWSLRGVAGLFGLVLIAAGFRLYMRIVGILGGAFVGTLGYDIGLATLGLGWPFGIVGAIAGFTLTQTSHRACFCLIGAFPGYVLGMYWTGHIWGGLVGAVVTGFFTMAFFNFGLVLVTSLLGALLFSFAITGHVEPWVVVYPTLMGLVIQGTTFPETLVACQKPPFVMPWRRSIVNRFHPTGARGHAEKTERPVT